MNVHCTESEFLALWWGVACIDKPTLLVAFFSVAIHSVFECLGSSGGDRDGEFLLAWVED